MNQINRKKKKLQSFGYRAPAALNVQLLGDFKGWRKQPVNLRKGEGGVWSTTLELEPGTYHYRFVVDGEWQDDPECTLRIPNPFKTEDLKREIA